MMGLSALFGPPLDADGFVIVPTDPDGFLPTDAVLTWESQVMQYPVTGQDGIGYFEGVVDANYCVDCLLWRGGLGEVLGILNHYPADFPPWERAHNVNLWVRTDAQRNGIGTALVLEALRRWPDIHLTAQRFTRAGKALADSIGDVS